MNVLSLFDGMSCGQLALNRAGINYNNYYASEIDKYAIKIAKKNYPNTIELGNVLDWQKWDLPEIDLLMAGSPCQGFSNAGHGLNFDDPRSKLFFTFVEILKEIDPEFWILENVKMKAEWRDKITKILGVEPVLINSSLVSAQNRQRLYWTNFPITQPDDKEIYLKDIIECGEVDRLKSYTIDANYFKGGNPRSYFEDGRRQLVFEHQSHKRAMVRIGTATDIKGHDYNRRVYSQQGKAPSLATHSGGNLDAKVAIDDRYYRKLTVLECERLQTVDEGFTHGVSNTQRYKMLGNGWTIDVICHILGCAYGSKEM